MDRRGMTKLLLAGLAAGMPGRRAWAQQHHMAGTGVAPMTGDGKGVMIFAAATLKPALDAAVADYGAHGGGEVTVAYGPTPALAKQIEGGAPADIFLSADPDWMNYLADRRLIRMHTRADLLRNTLILAGHGAQGTPGEIDGSFPLAKVIGEGHLCMCDPADHPAGRYGKASLEALGLWGQVADRIAIVENPLVAVTMVARGDAPAAVVFATDAKGIAGAATLGIFPEPSHPPIVYPVAETMGAPHAEAAEKVLAHLRSPEMRALFSRYGYR